LRFGRPIRIIISLFLIAAVLAVAAVIILYMNFSPEEVKYGTSGEALKYFHSTYGECRTAFRLYSEKLKEKYDGTEISAVRVESKRDTSLYIDYCYVPARVFPERLLILTSGVHGVEGFAGSAVQLMFEEELAGSTIDDKTGVLLIHAVNPFGFKYNRRVSENNVDLNRNCSSDGKLYSSRNLGYELFERMLNPEGSPGFEDAGYYLFPLTTILKIARYSEKNMRQAILQGQYGYPDGLYYGGNSLEQENREVTGLIKRFAAEYGMIFEIDLHTGYGKRGNLHLFPNPVEDDKVKKDIEYLFSGNKIDWGNSDDFYTITGNLSSYIGEILPGKYYLPMVFEFGTLDSQTLMGSIRSLHNMIIENQGFGYGYASKEDSLSVAGIIREMYYPSSEAWRSKILADSRKMLSEALTKFKNMPAREADNQ